MVHPVYTQGSIPPMGTPCIYTQGGIYIREALGSLLPTVIPGLGGSRELLPCICLPICPFVGGIPPYMPPYMPPTTVWYSVYTVMHAFGFPRAQKEASLRLPDLSGH